MKKTIVLLFVALLFAGCAMAAKKLVPKYMLIKDTDIKVAHIRINNDSIDILDESRGVNIYRGDIIAELVNSLNVVKDINSFYDIEKIRFFTKEWGTVNLTVSLCNIDDIYYIESIVAADDGIHFLLESLEYMDLSHLKILQSCSIPPASKDQTKKIAEYAPNLEILSLSPHIPFLEYDENEIVFLLSELEGIKSFEFIDDEKMESIFDDIPLFENKIEELRKKFPDCKITVRVINTNAVIN